MPESELLFRFHAHGDLEALVVFGKSIGYGEVGLRAALDALRTTFEGARTGEEPQYDRIDRRRLLEHREEALFVLQMMSSSHIAGVKAAGVHLLSELKDDSAKQ
jgi:hypothetical protein